MVAEGDKTLAAAMVLAFNQHSQGTTHYAIRDAVPAINDKDKPYLNKEAKPKRLVFMWTGGISDAVALPFKLDAAGAADFARRWLAETDYGEQPDHDGDNGKGWKLYNEGWGHVD